MKILKNKRVFVAMSGGVDSSVAAALLKKQGYEVTGVFFKPWQPENGLSFCNWKQDRQDAMKVAIKLKIPFLTWDFSKDYYRTVTKYMVDSYKKGITPNPDVMCNKEIKFGLFLKKALTMGADYIATGHYVRKNGKSGAYNLLKAKDKNKDQSYFLWTLTQKQLKYCLFPIGDYAKPEVRILAKKFGLSNWNKKDSQGVCFVGDLDMKEFLKEYIKPKTGLIKNKKGEIIGQHDGTVYYTIGQRHGFEIFRNDGPYYVTGKNTKDNVLFANKNKLENKGLKVKDISWVEKPEKFQIKVDVKIRYRHDSQKAFIIKNGSDKRAILRFFKPQTSATSGQSAVFYIGQKLIGGGVIL